MKTIENSAITALLLQLDQKVSGVPVTKSTYGNVADRPLELEDLVVEQAERIIDGTEQAKTLFRAEKKLISERGNDINDYLVRSSVSVKDVLEAYYRGVVDRNDFRRLSANYSISEMMLMLGTFMHLMEARSEGLEGTKKRSMQIKIGKIVQKVKGQKLPENKKQDLEFLETLVSNTKASEERMLQYMQDQVTVIMKSILEFMGSNFGLATKRQLAEICTSSHELCTTANVMESYFVERRRTFPAVYSDVALLDSCGEHSPKLYAVMGAPTAEEEKKKGTK